MRITLLTDFGTADGYVAAIKGVIASAAPGTPIDDAAHDLPPGDLRAAAWALAQYWRRYPPGTVHLAVVDPEVGTARRALAATVDGRHFVAPDNGVLTRVLQAGTLAGIVAIEAHRVTSDDISATFHGRDIFAPAAASLALGRELSELGPVISDPVLLDLPRPARSQDGVRGCVIHVDRFGNLITNVPAAWVRGATRVRVAGHDVGALRRTYGDVAAGAPLALIGSTGLLEVAVRDGSAARNLAVGRGAVVEIETVPDPE